MRYRAEIGEQGLSTQQLKDVMREISNRAARFQKLEDYYNGENRRIRQTSGRVGRTPIPIAYGQKITDTVVGYMFRPRFISYASDNEAYKDQLDMAHYDSHEEIITSELGKIASIYGVAYELHYVGEDAEGDLVPRFAAVSPKEMLGIHSYELGEDQLVAAVRWYEIDDRQHVDVYYADRIDKYLATKGGAPQLNDTVEHMYRRVPVVEYENNAERRGDFERVLPLIDAYDILMSDSVHEVDKLAEAYLVLTNHAMAEEDVERIKYKRIIELMESGRAEFLVKSIDPNFLTFVRDWIRQEIHQISQVPDVTDISFGGNQSGIAIRYKLYPLENICSVKEALFRRGLYERFRLLDAIMDLLWGNVGTVREIDITFIRNIPLNYMEVAQIVTQLRGHVSLETLLSEVVPFVQNATEEMQRLAAETDPYAELTDDGGEA